MLRIITGPVGQAFHLSSFSPSDQRLLVPTATMAEHIRNELARQGAVFRPDTIQTFSKFIDALIPDLPQITPGALAVLTSRAPRPASNSIPTSKSATIPVSAPPSSHRSKNSPPRASPHRSSPAISAASTPK